MGCKGSQVRILSPRPITYLCVRQDIRDADGTPVVPSVVPISNDVFQGDTLGQDEQGFLGGNLECPDLDQRRAEESLNPGGRCITDAQPDDC